MAILDAMHVEKHVEANDNLESAKLEKTIALQEAIDRYMSESCRTLQLDTVPDNIVHSPQDNKDIIDEIDQSGCEQIYLDPVDYPEVIDQLEKREQILESMRRGEYVSTREIQRPANVIILHPFDQPVEQSMRKTFELAGKFGPQISDSPSIFDVKAVVKMPDHMIEKLYELDQNEGRAMNHAGILKEDRNEFIIELSEEHEADIIQFYLPDSFAGPLGATACLNRFEGRGHRINSKRHPEKVNDTINPEQLEEDIAFHEIEGEGGSAGALIKVYTGVLLHELNHAANASNHHVGSSCTNEEERRALEHTFSHPQLGEVTYGTSTHPSFSLVQKFLTQSSKNGDYYMMSQDGMTMNRDGVVVPVGDQNTSNWTHNDGLTAKDYRTAFLEMNEHMNNQTTGTIEITSTKKTLLTVQNPIPVNSSTMLLGNTSTEEISHIQILDARGNVINSMQVSIRPGEQTQVDITDLNQIPGGWYVLRAFDNDRIPITAQPLIFTR